MKTNEVRLGEPFFINTDKVIRIAFAQDLCALYRNILVILQLCKSSIPKK